MFKKDVALISFSRLLLPWQRKREIGNEVFFFNRRTIKVNSRKSGEMSKDGRLCR
jgi:hypothetical protein